MSHVSTSQAASPRYLSTAALVKEIGAEVSNLAHKQLELAMTELKADLKREAAATAGLSVATILDDSDRRGGSRRRNGDLAILEPVSCTIHSRALRTHGVT